MRAAKRLVLVVAPKLTWFLCGWSRMTWFQRGGSNLTWFQFWDRNWFVLCLGVENDFVLRIWTVIDLDFVWWCSITKRYGVLTDTGTWYMCLLCSKNHSVTVDRVTQWIIVLNEQKRCGLHIPVRAHWVAQWFIRYKRTTEVRGSNPTKVVGQLFSEIHFSDIHLHTTARP